jgi:DNA-directed RNA polymerase specialized sigma24 family protein
LNQQQLSGSSMNYADPSLIQHSIQLREMHTGASIPHFTRVSPEDDDPIEDLLERYDFQYILERVKQTITSFSILQHLVEEIASEVYDKFWQRLRKGPVENPPAYIRKMIHNRCIDHMRRFVSETCHMVQTCSEGGLDILESDLVTADSEGLRDPAEEFEYKAALEECYHRITAAIAELPPRQQAAAARHLLRDADDPQFLMELFNAFHIVIPVIPPKDKDEEHLLDASYTHARKALARRLDIDLSKFKQTKRCQSRLSRKSLARL